MRQQVTQFGNAEWYLPGGSFFLPVREERPTLRGPAWLTCYACTSLASDEPRSDPVRIRPWQPGRLAQSASVARQRAQELAKLPFAWARKTSSRHAPAVLRCCAVAITRGSIHPLPSLESASSHKAARLCCPTQRRGVPRQDSASSVRLHPRGATGDRGNGCADRKQSPAHSPIDVLQATGATYCCCHTLHRLRPNCKVRQPARLARSCIAPALAWWQTGLLPAPLRRGNVRDRRPILLEGTPHDPATLRPCRWRSRETRQPGCSRCVLPCRCTRSEERRVGKEGIFFPPPHH